MSRYLLFSFVPRFHRGGLKDLDLAFDTRDDLTQNTKKIGVPNDHMYNRVYQLMDTKDNTIIDFVSRTESIDFEREPIENIRLKKEELLKRRTREVIHWLYESTS